MIREIELQNSGHNRMVVSRLQQFIGAQEERAFYSIKYVCKGTEVYGIDGKTYGVSAGEFLVSNYGKKYNIEINSKENVEGLCVFLQQSFLLDVYQNLKERDIYLLDNPFEKPVAVEINEMVFSQRMNSLGNYLSVLYAQLQSDDNLSKLNGDQLFYKLAVQLLNHQADVSYQQDKLAVMKKSTAQELFSRVMKAKNMIDEQPENEWSMSHLSHAVALSEFHFYRSFKKAFNVTPYQYIIWQRIVKASEMLLNSSYSVAEVALSSGFADIYSFSKAFKKYKGLSPTSFRRFC
jgi:AraC-like DNA-binding protein